MQSVPEIKLGQTHIIVEWVVLNVLTRAVAADGPGIKEQNVS